MIFLLSTNLQLLNIQNNFGLNHCSIEAELRVKQEQMRAFGACVANYLAGECGGTSVCTDVCVFVFS